METLVSSGIIESYFNKLKDCLELDAAIVGGGPSGIVAAYYLAKAGHKVALFDRKLSPGGGMWGGAMMFNDIVVQEEAMEAFPAFREISATLATFSEVFLVAVLAVEVKPDVTDLFVVMT